MYHMDCIIEKGVVFCVCVWLFNLEANVVAMVIISTGNFHCLRLGLIVLHVFFQKKKSILPALISTETTCTTCTFHLHHNLAIYISTACIVSL